MTTTPAPASPLIGQFLRFAMVGAAATALHYAIAFTLVWGAEVQPVIATTIGYVAGTLFSYWLNRNVTFDQRPEFGRGLAKYVAVVGIGGVWNAGLVALLTHWGASYLLAQVAATGLVLFWNFFASRLFVFGPARVG